MRIARVVVFVIERGKDGAASAAEEEVGTARAAAARPARAARGRTVLPAASGGYMA